jgi:hypothetical protein
MFNQAGLGLTPPSPLIHRHSSLGLCHVCLVRTTKETSLTHRPDKLGQSRQSCSSRPLPHQPDKPNKQDNQTNQPRPACPARRASRVLLHTRSLLALARIIHEHFCYNCGSAAATSLRPAGSPLGPSPYCTSTHRVLTAPHAGLATQLSEFAMNRHE